MIQSLYVLLIHLYKLAIEQKPDSKPVVTIPSHPQKQTPKTPLMVISPLYQNVLGKRHDQQILSHREYGHINSPLTI